MTTTAKKKKTPARFKGTSGRKKTVSRAKTTDSVVKNSQAKFSKAVVKSSQTKAIKKEPELIVKNQFVVDSPNQLESKSQDQKKVSPVPAKPPTLGDSSPYVRVTYHFQPVYIFLILLLLFASAAAAIVKTRAYPAFLQNTPLAAYLPKDEATSTIMPSDDNIGSNDQQVDSVALTPETLANHYAPDQAAVGAVESFETQMAPRAESETAEAKEAQEVVVYENAQDLVAQDIASMQQMGLSTAGIEEIVNQANEAERNGDLVESDRLFQLAHGLALELLLVYQSGVRP